MISQNQYGTSNLSARPPRFQGHEGIEGAQKTKHFAYVFLGQKNLLHFLTQTPEEYFAIPNDLDLKAKNNQDALASLKVRQQIEKERAEAYWGFMDFIEYGSAAYSLFEPFNATQNLPAIWTLFHIHYIGGPTLHGTLMLVEQLWDPSLRREHLLEEFTRIMGIFHQLERVAEDTSVMEKQPRLTAVFPSPARAPPRGLQFETPSASVRPNDSASASASDTLTTPATETSAPVGVSAQGGASFSAPVVRPTPTTQNTTQMSEWLKVLLSFFFLKNTSEFSAPMTNYLDKYILEKTSEQNSVFLLTESLHYSQLRTFLQLTDDESKKKQSKYQSIALITPAPMNRTADRGNASKKVVSIQLRDAGPFIRRGCPSASRISEKRSTTSTNLQTNPPRPRKIVETTEDEDEAEEQEEVKLEEIPREKV